MTKLEELKAAYKAACDAQDNAALAAWVAAFHAAYDAVNSARAAYQAELKKTRGETE